MSMAGVTWATTISMASSRTRKTITDAGLPSTAMKPWAVPPERTPPDARVKPVSHRVGNSLAASERSSLQKSMWHIPPKR